MLTIDQVREIAVRARRALALSPLRIGAENFDITFAHFPKGACSDTCLLVAELYRREGCDVRVVAGRRSESSQSHVWLSVDGVVVDLTADQFVGEGQPAVLVAESSWWHAETWRPSTFTQAMTDYSEPQRGHFQAALIALVERMGRRE